MDKNFTLNWHKFRQDYYIEVVLLCMMVAVSLIVLKKGIKMSIKFDMEQQILQCWAITDEIDLFLWAKDKGMTEDQELNHLIGLKQLYHVKFEKLWELYENLLQEDRQAKSSFIPSKVNLPAS